MAVLKTNKFTEENDLVEFVSDEQIQKEDIVTITHYGGYYTLFYYQ